MSRIRKIFYTIINSHTMIIEGVRVRICGPSCRECNLKEAEEQRIERIMEQLSMDKEKERGKKELTPEDRKILEDMRRKINEARKTLEEREREMAWKLVGGEIPWEDEEDEEIPWEDEEDEEMDDNVTTKNDKEGIKYLVLRDSEDKPLYLIEHSGKLPKSVLIGSTFYTYQSLHRNSLEDMRVEYHYRPIEVLEYPQFRAYS